MSIFSESFRKPAASNHFNVEFKDSDWQKEWLDIFSNQVEWVNISLTSQIVSIGVRQLSSGHIQDLIMHIMQSKYQRIEEARVYPIHGRPYEYVFSNGTLTNHDVKYNYSDRGPLVHKLVFDFETVILHSEKNNGVAQTLSKKKLTNL